jgi:hypothetical protein
MNKIEALEKTIYNLENNLVEYNWTESNSCNCGVLARTVIDGKSIWEMGYGEAIPAKVDVSAFSKRAYCMTTNMPLPKVFKALVDAGFLWEELKELEQLENKKILRRIGAEELRRDIKENLVSYLKAWVEILKEEQPIVETQPTEEPKVKEIIRYVSVPQTITEQSKELILS